ncbi:fucose-1-phosphate guanylyltransferase isoform X2 [Echeneis naucrates]|uniref:GDP-fucose pyrophosphorylase domain-containing protein n=1 Tax=Echeneis naucrates TaxID=173247 RepID=A0A665UQW7_ECHNA|nr:fucose-1-phosphate guanylyltransferase isoform X2 [Echeneis naucrates]XP_029355338.1 fucose-1-phosphate guanylyltransferase isoform X2 [Echeneis naucrates]
MCGTNRRKTKQQPCSSANSSIHPSIQPIPAHSLGEGRGSPWTGNGGSTLYALQQLDDIYGKALGQLRVILIHAGGFSQRLPSASALGKIFTAMPLGDPLYQMLELKLAMYVDFPSHMKPGVLVTCADDIELYSIAEEEHVMFHKPGFTALAHPSSLSIGTTHGVFVLESCEKSQQVEMEISSCLRFLHKPSIKTMHDCGAVCKRPDGSLSEFVYTDSTYFIDFETVKTLRNLLKELGPLQCEIDAYGDFLQALGPKASLEYTDNIANVTKEESCLVEIRQKIFWLLQGTPLNVILLNNSKFYHIGTTLEYLFHLTEDVALRSELGLQSSAFSIHTDESSGSCVMCSVLDPSCSVGAGSVVEYCRLGAGVSVGRGSVVSSCWVSPGLSVPDAVFMHSLCVSHQGRTGFVTVAFGIDDNLKHSVEAPAHMERLRLFECSLADCLSHWGMDSEVLRFSGDTPSCSLWNACLFPVCSDQRSSFSLSLEMLKAVLSGSTFALTKGTKLMSMQESLQSKNLEEMLTFRKGLYKDITERRQKN